MMNVIALLTDFGLRDTYVAQMHGVIAQRDTALRVIDVTHAIPPQNVLAGAYALSDAVAAFPPGTIFVAVVDPGVGSTRRAIAAEFGAWRFVGPDNGLLSVLLDQYALATVVELTNPAYHRQPRSSTFHGRDIFAPVAAAWATGIPIAAFGPPCTTPLVRLDHAKPTKRTEGKQELIAGVVIDADHFGNICTNIHRDDLRGNVSNGWNVKLDDTAIGPLANCYADGTPGDVLALFGSNDRLEIAICRGSAAQRFPHAKMVSVVFPVPNQKHGS